MRTCVDICVHCGKEYMWQASGSWALDTPEKYNSDKYCPDCKKALDDALAAIPVLFVNKNVKIQDAYEFDPKLKEITPAYIFDLINKKEEELKKKSEESGWPICRRVYANFYNSETNEHSVSGEVQDRIDVEHRYYKRMRNFSYFYWPSKPEEMNISVSVRIDAKTNKILDYARHNHSSSRDS